MVVPVGRKARIAAYRPLPADGKTVRLITFDTPSGSLDDDGSLPPLGCTVKFYSLEARTPHYKDLSSGYAGDKNWHFRNLTNFDPSEYGFSHGYHYRYEWGDWLAMSHCWGTEEATELIYVNHEPYWISANMAAGLRAISQLPAVRNGNLKVWNDFLCLDQDNQAEIQRELKRVPQIYSNAFAVVAWVGPAADYSHLVMTLLGTKLHRSYSDNADASQALKSIQGDEWRALIAILQRPYWRRIWVTQELILAGSRTVMLCGHDSAPLASMWDLVKAMIRNTGLCHRLMADALGRTDTYYDPERHQAFSIVARLLYLHDIDEMRRRKFADDKIDLLPLLDVCRDSEQMYLRDKVYGVLGLLPANITRLIEPDLNKAPHYVYRDLVLASIQAQGRLDILQNCIYNATYPVLPSWTPDLERSSMSHAIGSRMIMDAGGDLPSQPRISPDRQAIYCQGFLLDEIDHLTPPQWPLDPISLEDGKETVARAETPSVLGNHQDVVAESLWKVLVGGSAGFPHDKLPPEHYSELLNLPWPANYDSLQADEIAQDLIDKGWCSIDETQDLITFVTFRQRAGRSFDICGHPLSSFFPSDHPVEDPNRTTTPIWSDRRMLRQACNTLKRRRLFVTREGRLGVCGRQGRSGDKVALLRGCSTALLLRRWPGGAIPDVLEYIPSEAEEAYVVVGACYIDGGSWHIMQGEWVKYFPEQEREIMLL